jgi:hypothetical protein
MSQLANLRVCASCEFIFRREDTDDDSCPECQFGHYGARRVYGDKAYGYERTQKPYLDKQLDKLRTEMRARMQQRKVAKVTKELLTIKSLSGPWP